MRSNSPTRAYEGYRATTELLDPEIAVPHEVMPDSTSARSPASLLRNKNPFADRRDPARLGREKDILANRCSCLDGPYGASQAQPPNMSFDKFISMLNPFGGQTVDSWFLSDNQAVARGASLGEFIVAAGSEEMHVWRDNPPPRLPRKGKGQEKGQADDGGKGLPPAPRTGTATVVRPPPVLPPPVTSTGRNTTVSTAAAASAALRTAGPPVRPSTSSGASAWKSGAAGTAPVHSLPPFHGVSDLNRVA